jgi:hypothetical protein
MSARQGHRSVTVQHHTEKGKRMKLVPTFVVVVFDARDRCTQYLDAAGKRCTRWEHAHKFISRGAAEEFAAEHNGRVLEYAARAVEERCRRVSCAPIHPGWSPIGHGSS